MTCECGWRMSLHVSRDDGWDEMHNDTGSGMLNVIMLSHEMKSGVKWNVLKFLGKNLQFLKNGEKTKMQTSKTQK